MAGKRTENSALDTLLQVHTCGECVSAYGFCIKGFSGNPVCCRCRKDPRYLKLCSQPSCKAFEPSGRPLPEEYSFVIV